MRKLMILVGLMVAVTMVFGTAMATTSADTQTTTLSDDKKGDKPEWSRRRDWGSKTVPVYQVGLSSDQGLLLGGGFSMNGYQFGKLPYGYRHSLTAAYSSGLSTGRGTPRSVLEQDLGPPTPVAPAAPLPLDVQPEGEPG